MNRYIILLIGLVFCFSCSKKPKSDEFKVGGFLSNGANRYLIINEISPSGNIFIDTIWVDKNGEFEYTYKMPYKSFYILETDENEFVTLLPNYQEIINIEGDYEYLSPTYSVNGSAESQLLWKLNKKELEGIAALNEINKIWSESVDLEDSMEIKSQLDTFYYDTWMDQKAYYYDFIYDNKGSLATIIALYKTFNQRPLFPVDVDAELYQVVLEGLKEKIPQNPHTKHFERSYQRKSIQLKESDVI